MSSRAAMRVESAPFAAPKRGGLAQWRRSARLGVAQVNRELWILLAIFAIAALLNFLLASGRMVLGFYALPTLFSAYYYGRRHAVLTACASAFLMLVLATFNPAMLGGRLQFAIEERWFDFTIWAGTLVVTAYFMGTLYERKEARLRDLRQSYECILLILQYIASDDKYSQNHPYRVSVLATKIAEQMELDAPRIEHVRAAALLHEIDKVGVTRDILYQAANMKQEEFTRVQAELEPGRDLSAKHAGSLQHIIEILLAYTALLQDGKGQAPASGPVEARILLVADAYDSLTSARHARVSPSEAMERILQRAGLEYDAGVVAAMVRVFRKRGMQPAELAETYPPLGYD